MPSSAEDLTQRVEAFAARINHHDPCALADRLWIKDTLDPNEGDPPPLKWSALKHGF